jgi:hypothetical protein
MNASTDEEWFDEFECRNDGEREFVRAMSEHAKRWQAVGISPGDLHGAVVSFDAKLSLWVDICDSERIVRSLCIEFDGRTVAMGDDVRMQGGPIDPSRPVVTISSSSLTASASAYRGPSLPALLAAHAAAWVEEQLAQALKARQEAAGKLA